MKKLLLVLLLAVGSFATVQAQEIKWMSLDEALAAQKKKPKPIFMDVYTDWCGPCKMLDKNTFQTKEVSEYISKNYYAVKLDAESKENITLFGRTFSNPGFVNGKKRNSMHEFTNFMNVNAVPTTVFLDEQSMPITILQGALTAKELEPYLLFIATDDYKKINTREQWENYQKKFKSSIKN